MKHPHSRWRHQQTQLREQTGCPSVFGEYFKVAAQACLVLAGGAAIALITAAFASMVTLVHSWQVRWVDTAPWLAWLLVPSALAVARWLTLRYAPLAEGSGIPQVMAAMSLEGRPYRFQLVSLMQSLWKIPLALLALLFGASIGREGPSVQIGAAIMVAWSQFWEKRGLPFHRFQTNELMATGAAAGLAAAFNAPLAGVIFAIEELGRDISLRWYGILVATVLTTAYVLDTAMGNIAYFGIFTGAALERHMLVWTLACAVLCGLTGGLFAWLLTKGPTGVAPAAINGWMRRHPVLVAFLLGLVVAAIGHFSAYATFGTGYGVTKSAMAGNPVEGDTLGAAKLAATVASYWAGIPGGIFTPALTAGAGFGANLASLTGNLVDQRVLVLLCMAAFLAAATQAPLTAAVITMEMTSSGSMLLWLLIVSVCASQVSRLICPVPFYHASARVFADRLRTAHNDTSDGQAQGMLPGKNGADA